MILIALARVLAEPRAGDPPPGFLCGIEQTAAWMGLRTVVALVSLVGARQLVRRPVPAA
jgi:hypothetical protein